MNDTDTSGSALADVERWAEQQFGDCQLGDTRRTRRLVDYAARQAVEPAASTHSVCAGNDAVAEGTYRWMRNHSIDPKAVEEGPFQATVDVCGRRKLVLAVQDTTTLVFAHSVADELGNVGGGKEHNVPGLLVHSTLMVDAHSGEPLGLSDQQRWSRPPTPVGSKPKRPKATQQHKRRAYEDKESAKWEQATEAMCGRLLDTSDVITVCDREADIYEYLSYLIRGGHRFVVRAAQDRSLLTHKGNLFDVMAKQPVVGKRLVEIAQRGAQRGTAKQKKRAARPARTACMSIRVATVALARPANRHDGPESLRVAVVYLRERNAPKGEDPAEWLLLTTERISTRREFEQVIQHYEHRWLIEEFHKSWKTGCRIEHRRFQSVENLERIMAVTAPIAVRLLQLRFLSRSTPNKQCTIILSPTQWQCLFAKTEPERPVPKRPPSVAWAFRAIARLAGWRDTKRTGKVGWQMLWRGWAKLESLVEGWRLAQRRS